MLAKPAMFLAVAVLALALPACSGPPEPARTEVVYFHRTVRCPSCETIEAWTKSAVAADVDAGRVTCQVLNLDEPANAPLEDRYSLVAQSVVLREIQAGNEVRWKNLDKVWDLLADETAFRNYIQQEVRAFLTGQQEAKS